MINAQAVRKIITINKMPKGGKISINKNEIRIPPQNEPIPSIKYTFSGSRIFEAAGNNAPIIIEVGASTIADIITMLPKLITSPNGKEKISSAYLIKHIENITEMPNNSSNKE